MRQYAQSDFALLDPNDKFEEERHPIYTPKRFYDVRIGEVFNSKYQFVGSLGFGVCSTVWLCKDLKYVPPTFPRKLMRTGFRDSQHKYVAIKNLVRDSTVGKRKYEAYILIGAWRAFHNGAKSVRTVLDGFHLDFADGSYQCLVHKLLGIRLKDI